MNKKKFILLVLLVLYFIPGYNQCDCNFEILKEAILKEKKTKKGNFYVLFSYNSQNKEKNTRIVLNKFNDYTFYFMTSESSKSIPKVKFYKGKTVEPDSLLKIIKDSPDKKPSSFNFSMNKKLSGSTARYYTFSIEFGKSNTGCALIAFNAKDDIKYQKAFLKMYKKKFPKKYKEMLQKVKEKDKEP